MGNGESGERTAPTAYEIWEAEKGFREREVRIKERELDEREAERRQKHWWKDPLIIAIAGATLAVAGNLFVAFVNGSSDREVAAQEGMDNREVARQQGQTALLLQMLNTGGDPDQAAENLRFVLDAGLITDEPLKAGLYWFLARRDPGTGPALSNSGQFDPASLSPEFMAWMRHSSEVVAQFPNVTEEALDALCRSHPTLMAATSDYHVWHLGPGHLPLHLTCRQDGGHTLSQEEFPPELE